MDIFPDHLGGHFRWTSTNRRGALDQATPLAGWELPEEFALLRRVLESRMSKGGKRSSSRCSG